MSELVRTFFMSFFSKNAQRSHARVEALAWDRVGVLVLGLGWLDGSIPSRDLTRKKSTKIQKQLKTYLEWNIYFSTLCWYDLWDKAGKGASADCS